MNHVCVERDFDMLARWLNVIEGHAAGIAPTIGSGVRDGRGDSTDDHHTDLARALDVLERLRRVAGQDDYLGCVLVYAYLLTCTADRARSGFEEDLGVVLASREQRLDWLTNPAKAQGSASAAAVGRRARNAADDLYRDVDTTGPLAGAGWLASARDRVTRRALAAKLAQRDCRKAREQARCETQGANAAITPSKPSRAQRRAHLQRKPQAAQESQNKIVEVADNAGHPVE